MENPADGGMSEELVDAHDLATGVRLARDARVMSSYPRLLKHIDDRTNELISFLVQIGVPEYHHATARALMVVVASESALAMRTAILNDLLPVDDFDAPPPDSDCDVPF